MPSLSHLFWLVLFLLLNILLLWTLIRRQEPLSLRPCAQSVTDRPVEAEAVLKAAYTLQEKEAAWHGGGRHWWPCFCHQRLPVRSRSWCIREGGYWGFSCLPSAKIAGCGMGACLVRASGIRVFGDRPEGQTYGEEAKNESQHGL